MTALHCSYVAAWLQGGGPDLTLSYFLKSPCPTDVIKWLVNKSQFSHYDARRSQVEGRDKETIDYRNNLHTQTILLANQQHNQRRDEAQHQDNSLTFHTKSSAAQVVCQHSRAVSSHQEPRKDVAKLKRSSLDKYGCPRLTVRHDLAEAGDPQNISGGMAKALERKRRDLGEKMEQKIFAPVHEPLSPRHLSDLEEVRHSIYNTMTDQNLHL